jgi:uncharacterized protein (TIGR02246 family)
MIGVTAGRMLLLGWIVATAGCTRSSPSTTVAPSAAEPEADTDAAVARAIEAVLAGQRDAWNRGDIVAFMDAYVHDDTLVFTSGGKVRRGWAATLERYRARYRDAAAMGRLTFSALETRRLGADAAVVLGRWQLDDTPEAGHGVFSLVFVRAGDTWKILHDHTSAGAPPTDGGGDAAARTALATPTDPVRRAIASRLGALYPADTGAPMLAGDGGPAWESLEVVGEDSGRVRVVISAMGGAVRLLAWVDRADLAPQLSRPAVLEASPDAARRLDDGGITLAPGEEIEVLERRGPAARVRTRDGEFDGWIDAEALAPIYVAKPFPIPAVDAHVAPGTAVAARPGGKAIYTFGPLNDDHEVRRLGAARGGWVDVEYVVPCRETVRVRGRVRVAAAPELAGPTTKYGCGRGGGIDVIRWGELEGAEAVSVTADTELRDATGTLVGRVTRDVELRRGADGQLRVATPWGLMVVHTP